jgi:RNA polymerase sigma-70 factor (ECF subfamily)
MLARQAFPDSTLSDADLMHGIVHGDQNALMALYGRYGNQVYSLALRVLRHTTLAEEATQDTFLKVWHKSLSWDPSKGQLGSWLLTIARYTAIDHLRREQRQDATEIDQLESLPDPSPSFGIVGDARWHDGQLLRELMAELPSEQAQVIELAFFQGLTHSELAEQLGLPLGTVKTRARLGLQKLRALWAESSGS